MPQVASTLNNSLNKATGETPFFINHGRDHTLPYDLIERDPEPVYNPDDYVNLRTSYFQQINQHIRDRLAAAQQQMLSLQHRRAKTIPLENEDVVFVQIHDRQSKLDTKFEGPYRVINNNLGNKAELLNLTTLEKKIVHRDHLKKVSKHFDTGVTAPDPVLPDSTPDATTHTQAPENTYRHKLRSHTKRVGHIYSPLCTDHIQDLNVDLLAYSF
jgi:hypothetical protein